MNRTVLPVDAHIARIAEIVRVERRAIVVAPPGSGKTTRIPPALAELGPTILLQPRRVAARALARRIAAEQGWTVGEEIGWHIRLERRFSKKTRLLVATEGILTARLQSDPLLSDFRVVILDEFHERSVHADLALALARQAALSRDDLALVVMSATLDTAPLAAFLDAKVIEIDARMHPVEVRYRPQASVAEAAREALATAKGHILAFLPGAREIERAAAALSGVDANVLPLHGSMEVEAQERALASSSEKKIILATNVAETSLTVEGVTDVIDSGLQKVLRYDSETAVDHLVTEQIASDSAEQRAGRAGRTAPGRATRLWDERAILRPHREPEVRRIDLAGPVLDIISWGGDPLTFEWYERPPAERLQSALDLLTRLGAIDGHRLTPLGEQIRLFPLHPRLARMIVAAGGASDAVSLADEISEGRRPVRQSLRELNEIAQRILGAEYRRELDDLALRRAVLAAYPDRVAQRREKGSPRLLLSSGTGATLAREIEHTGGEFFVVLDIRGEIAHRVLAIEREWLTPNRREVTHQVSGEKVLATERTFYDAIPLREQQVPPDPLEVARLAARELRAGIDPQLVARVALAGLDVAWDLLCEQAAPGSHPDVSLLPWDVRRRLDALAPASYPLPSGRSAKLEYRDDGSVLASAKLQELFGLAETPLIGPSKTPITFALLSPSGRPVQVTQDLLNFWNTTYFEVRKELRGRYPKHPWPDDPWTARATHRAKPRG